MSQVGIQYDVLVDASGLQCPMPLLKAKQALNRMENGQMLKVVATDAGSVRDFKSFIDLTDHSLVEQIEESQSYVYYIKKAG